MKGLIFPRQHLPILSANLPLLYRAFPADHDFGTTLLLNVFKSVTTWPNKKAYKVNFRVFILRYHNFVTDSSGRRLIICRWFKVWVKSKHLRDEGVTLFLDLLSSPILTSV